MSHVQTVLLAAQGRGLLKAIGLVAVVSLPIWAAITWGGPFFHDLNEAWKAIAVGMT